MTTTVDSNDLVDVVCLEIQEDKNVDLKAWNMIIGSIKKHLEKDVIKLESLIEYNEESRLLWYSFDKSVSNYVTDEVHDGFLVGLLLLGMKLGEDIYIKGAISEKLYYNLTNYYMDIVASVSPEFKKIKIYPERLSKGNEFESKGEVITGFSAGIDSFCTIYDHSTNETPDGYKITHFLFNNVGSHGEYNDGKAEELFLSRYELIKGFTTESGLDFIKVNSNLSSFLKMNFQQTHTPRNVSSVLMLQKLIGKYYYASSYRYQDSFVGKAYDMAFSDPFAIHLLSTEALNCISSGCQHSRVEKTRRVSEVPSSKEWLNVCVTPTNNGGNCSSCSKCNRTLITLEILDKINDYKKVFDIGTWNYAKKWYIPEVILNKKNKDPLINEIRELASAKDFSFSVGQKALGLLVSYMPNNLYSFFKKVYHKL